MNREALDAALRLSATLPKRTHHCGDDERPEGKNGAGVPKRVEINGREFASINAAARYYKTSSYIIAARIDEGKGRYL